MRSIVRFLVLIFILSSCSNPEDKTSYNISRIKRVLSSDGHEAYIIESTLNDSNNTQVIINFAGGKCGAGAVNSLGVDLNLDIEWSDGATLVVSKPEQVNLTRNASDEILQCSEMKVLVVVENYEVTKGS